MVKRLCDHYQGDVPVLPTIFSNIVWMGEMTAGHYHQEVIVSQFKQSEKYAKMGMEVVAETNERLMGSVCRCRCRWFLSWISNGNV